jgi:hypothetical protein
MTASRQLFCLARRALVSATPEEIVRQELLSHLLGSFGCPRHLLAVEAPLRAISSRQVRLTRRLDIVCFCVKASVVVPLLVIECKAAPPKRQALTQLNGYNFYLQAPFLALAWPGSVILLHGNKALYTGGICDMPTYSTLQTLSS